MQWLLCQVSQLEWGSKHNSFQEFCSFLLLRTSKKSSSQRRKKQEVLCVIYTYSITGRNIAMSEKYLISMGCFINFIVMVLALHLISSSQLIKCSNSSVLGITVINGGRRGGRRQYDPQSSILVNLFYRKEWLIHSSSLDLGITTFLLKMEHLSSQ